MTGLGRVALGRAIRHVGALTMTGLGGVTLATALFKLERIA